MDGQVDLTGVAFMSNSNERSENAAVVLLSGGLDSATTAAIARHDGYELYALWVDYGQRHRFELDAARRVAESLGVRRHVVASVGIEPVRWQLR